MLYQKFLDSVNMDAMSDMDERVIGNFHPSPVLDDLFVPDIKSQMQMTGHVLHPVNESLAIEQRSATLAAKPGRAHLNGNYLLSIPAKPCNDTIHRESR